LAPATAPASGVDALAENEDVAAEEEAKEFGREQVSNGSSTPVVASTLPAEPNDEDAERLALEKGFLTEAESRARGSILSRVLRAYLSFIGWTMCAVIVLSMFLMQGTRNACDWWLSYWVEQATRAESGGSSEDADDAHYYLRVFAYLAAANSAAALFRAFIFAYGGLRAARVLFHTLLAAVLKAPVAFFDANPVGRILNRFSSDMYSLDESIPFQANIFLAQLFMLIGSLVVIAAVVPAILIILPVLCVIYYKIQAAYRSVSRELRRLDSTTRSPIYANFSETITGASVVRAFGFERLFQDRNELILDRNQKVQFANLGTSNWLNLRLQCIGVTMITIVAFLAIISCLYPVSWMHFFLNPAMVGLGIAYALPLTDTMNGLIGSFTDTEKEVISVERTVEYIRVKSEDADEWNDALEDEEGDEESAPRRRKVGGINEVSGTRTQHLPVSHPEHPIV
jgi:ATP-binding cassette subfamily C (CFTR/MRP) protein 10